MGSILPFKVNMDTFGPSFACQLMAPYENSPSRSFTTPEQRRQRLINDVNDTTRKQRPFCDSPSPITALHFREEEQDEHKSEALQDQHWGFAHSHFRRRNKLETRLEELQKDVTSLTLKLRTNGSRNTSLDTSGVLYPPKQQERKIDKTPKLVEERLKSAKKIVLGSGVKGSGVKTLRELHDVTTERDQLRFELERTKKALIAAERKLRDEQKRTKAYEKLKTHCDSLQDSLDLSEKIRGRQKKLLQQWQVQQQQKEDKETRYPMAKRLANGGVKTRGGSKFCTTPNQAQPKTNACGYLHTSHDILDSLVASSPEQDEDAGLSPHEQAPSEPTAATSRARTPRAKLMSTTPTSKAHRQDFDCLLQEVYTPQFSTRRPSRIATRSPQRANHTQREGVRQAARWARSREGAVDISTTTTQPSLRKFSTTGRPKHSFLAPTQASLRRLYDLPRRKNQDRPPFVV